MIHHDGESESRMGFRFFHQGERRIIAGSSLPIPINNYAINASADHVLDLTGDLRGAGGVVSDVHMAVSAEPAHKMGINFCVIPRVKQ